MMSFRIPLREFKLPMSTVWLTNDIAEAKGRLSCYGRCAKWRWSKVSSRPTESKG